MLADKSEAVKGLTGGIEYLFKKNKVEWLKGHAAFTAKDAVKVGDRTVRAKNIVIATGSSVTPLPGVQIDNDRSEEHTSELQSLMRISYAVFCWKNKNKSITSKLRHLI